MMPCQELFRDEETSEFVVVSIPSVLAVAETERLIDQLREEVGTSRASWPLDDSLLRKTWWPSFCRLAPVRLPSC